MAGSEWRISSNRRMLPHRTGGSATEITEVTELDEISVTLVSSVADLFVRVVAPRKQASWLT